MGNENDNGNEKNKEKEANKIDKTNNENGMGNIKDKRIENVHKGKEHENMK